MKSAFYIAFIATLLGGGFMIHPAFASPGPSSVVPGPSGALYYNLDYVPDYYPNTYYFSSYEPTGNTRYGTELFPDDRPITVIYFSTVYSSGGSGYGPSIYCNEPGKPVFGDTMTSYSGNVSSLIDNDSSNPSADFFTLNYKSQIYCADGRDLVIDGSLENNWAWSFAYVYGNIATSSVVDSELLGINFGLGIIIFMMSLWFAGYIYSHYLRGIKSNDY